MISFRIEATISLSYSHYIPIAPIEIIYAAAFGTFLDNGDMFYSFCANLNRPELRKSKCGTNATLSF